MALGAAGLRDRLASGALKAIDLVEICIKRIEARDPEIRAWAWFDAEYAREQARRMDTYRGTGRALGPLHGLPVGIKDVIDTRRIPTENGTPADAGRVPKVDAFVIDRLRSAGAIIMGKTMSTELAFLTPGPTRNPHNPGHTPGGSSSGSAAAVADGMVPLALGTQTAGSVLRPASFCGVTGFKPTFGAIPRTGVLTQAPSLDTVGVFATDAAGVALVADALFGHDPADRATELAPPPALFSVSTSKVPAKPVLAVVKVPGWDDIHPDMDAAITELTEMLGERAFRTDLPSVFDEAIAQHRRVHLSELAKSYARYDRQNRDALSDGMKAAIDEGRGVSAVDYLAARDWQGVLTAGLDEIFERADAILCPASPGPAPEGLETTGSPVFNSMATFCGLPAVSLPLLTAENGMPMGVQLIGRRWSDARLLRTARWLNDFIWADAPKEENA